MLLQTKGLVKGMPKISVTVMDKQ